MTPGIGSWIMLSSALFCIGLAGVLLRRNPLVILLSLEIMLNAGQSPAGRRIALRRRERRPRARAHGHGRRRRRGRRRPRPDRRARAPRLPAGRRRAAEPARMNAGDYGWLVLLSPLLGLAFNIGVGPSVSRRAVGVGGIALGARRLRASRCSPSSTCSGATTRSARSSRRAGTGSRAATSRSTRASSSTRSRP